MGSGTNLLEDLEVVSTGSGANLLVDLVLVSTGSGTSFLEDLAVVSTGSGANLLEDLAMISTGSAANRLVDFAVVSTGSGMNLRGLFVVVLAVVVVVAASTGSGTAFRMDLTVISTGSGLNRLTGFFASSIVIAPTARPRPHVSHANATTPAGIYSSSRTNLEHMQRWGVWGSVNRGTEARRAGRVDPVGCWWTGGRTTVHKGCCCAHTTRQRR
jgi:hypothetical protein